MRLKEIRTSKGLGQKDVARALECSVQVYSRYETGDREPSVDTLIRLADFYKITLDELVGREPVKVTGYQATELPPVKPGMVRIAIAPGENLSEEEIGRRITQAVLNQVPDLVEKELKKRGL